MPYKDLKEVIKNLRNNLKEEGYFYLSFKYGEFEGERNGRYFTNMTEKKFRNLIKDILEYEIVEEKITSDARKGREEEKWLNIILKKVKYI